jgi:magnesium chelatase accessory protein
MSLRTVWQRDGGDWPNRQASRFVTAGGLTWHVQVAGEGPVLLLLHGTAASTHSWRDLLPLLARDYTVVAPDLPGHGFTASPPPSRLSLPGMAGLVAALLREMRLSPEFCAGHSAGAAVLARMILDGTVHPAAMVSLNGALLKLRGQGTAWYAPLARLFFALPVVPVFFSVRAGDRRVVERLLVGTGSRIDPVGVALYQRLMQRPSHVAAALGMMANWDLASLEPALPLLATRLLLLAGERDAAIPPVQARRVQGMVPGARVLLMPGVGHLAHEESPGEVAAAMSGFFAEDRLARAA